MRRLSLALPKMMVLILAILLSACSVSLISEKDPASQALMHKISKEIDYLYFRMLGTESTERHYDGFKNQYIKIKTDLADLKRRQAIRANNELTLKQVDIAIALWEQDMTAHREKDTVSDFLLKRHHQQYQTLFIAMIKGEEAKPVNE